MAFKKFSEQIVKMDKELAARWAAMPFYTDDRVLRPERVKLIREAVEEGLFTACTWVSARWEGQEYRLNGKHTSNAFKECSVAKLAKVSVTVVTYDCDDLEDMADIYSSFDSRLSARTVGDINRGYAATSAELRGIPVPILNVCAAALDYAIHGEGGKHRLASERAKELLDHVPFCKFVDDLVRSVSQKEAACLRRAPVVAAIFKTFKVSAKASEEFWRLVATGAHPDRKNPSRVLQLYLMSVVVKYGAGAAATARFRQAVTRREIFAKCVHGWNAWRRGKPTALQYFAAAPLPKAV